jgi:hypothetical protein
VGQAAAPRHDRQSSARWAAILASGHPFREFVLKTATGEDGLLVAEVVTLTYCSDDELASLTDRLSGEPVADLLEKWVDAHWSDEQVHAPRSCPSSRERARRAPCAS